MKKTSLLLLALLSAVAVNLTNYSHASALSAADWSAGYIIDDATFTDKNSMSVAEIQTFLNQQVGTGGYGRVAGQCDTYGQAKSELGGGTRAQYGAANGNPAPFTCLKDYYEVPKVTPSAGMPANNYGGKAIPSGAKSAAQLIYDAAQRYSINPKVLLVKLHTESAGPLTSDDWPTINQYRYAMGARCPDSGPGGSANCDTNYAGFSIQISEAAALMRYYLDNMTQSWWPYKKPFATNYILWNVVERNCGGTNVYIESAATAALYTYTPYQPNQAALNNMNGTGDNCSAYGNRNFWRVYNNWFGPTNGYIIRTQEDGKMYLRGDNNSYYYITSNEQLKNIGYGLKVNRILNTNKAYLNSMTYAGDLPNAVRFGAASEVYLLDSGNRYYFSYASYQAFGSPAVGTLPGSYFNYLYPAPDLSTVVRKYGDENLFALEAGKKRHIGGPGIYASDGYNTIPVTSLSSFTVGNIPKGAPLLSAGTLTKTSDSNIYGIVKSDKQTQQPIDTTSAKSLSIPYYSDLSTYLNLLNRSGSSASLLAKDSSNNLFLIDGSSKYNLSASQLQSINKTAADFSLVDQAFLASLTTRVANSQNLLVRVAYTGTVFVAKNGELYKIESLRDFNSSGYNFNDVIDVTQNTFDNSFSYWGKSFVLPGSLFRKGNEQTVYILSRDGKAYSIPSANLFEDYGFKFTNVSSVNDATFQSIQKAGALTNYFSAPDGSQWLSSYGTRYWISASVSAQYRNSSSNYTLLDPALNINGMKVGQNVARFIKLNNSQNVYYVIGSTKRLLGSPSAFYANGGTSWTEVVSISPSVFDSLPTGPVLD
jgi:hypothetical protein